MFDRDFLARGLDENVPCEMPVGIEKRCGQPAGWSVPVGRAFLPCCPVHMEGALQIYRANKQQFYLLQRQLESDQEDQQHRGKAQKQDPDTEGFRNDRFPRPPQKK